MKTALISAALLLVCLLRPGSPVVAQDKPASAIRGRVVDAADGRGIEGIDVHLRGVPVRSGVVGVLRSGSDSIMRVQTVMVPAERVVRTGLDGSFAFDNLTAGSYGMYADSDGYSRAQVDVVIAGAARQDVTVRLQRSPPVLTLSGTVRDSNDKALTDVRVCLKRRYYDDLGSPLLTDARDAMGPRTTICVMTDLNGRYTIDKVDPGSYFVEAFPAGSYAYNPGSGIFYPGTDDFRDASPIVIRDLPIYGADIRMEHHPLWKVRGEVVAAGVVPAQTDITIHVHRNGRIVYTAIAKIIPGTDRRSFEVSGLSDGSYEFDATAPGVLVARDRSKLSPGMAGFTQVDIRAADVNDVQMVMDPDAYIRVIVLRPGEPLDNSLLEAPSTATSLLPPGFQLFALPGAGLSVQASTVDGTIVKFPDPATTPPIISPMLACRNGSSNVFTQLGGSSGRTLLLSGVHRTQCLLEIDKYPEDNYVESAKLDGEEIWDRLFIPSASSSNLVVTLADGGGIISGRILDERGNVFSAPITVILVPVAKPGDHPSANIRFQNGATGAFELHNIRPGVYHVLAFAGAADSNPYNNIRLIEENETRGTPLTIKRGGRETADVIVIRIP